MSHADNRSSEISLLWMQRVVEQEQSGGVARGDRLQDCHGDKLSLIGCPLLGSGQIKGTSTSQSLTGCFISLRNSLIKVGTYFLGASERGNFAFCLECLLSLFFTHRAWDPGMFIILEASDSKQLPENQGRIKNVLLLGCEPMTGYGMLPSVT